MINIRKCVIFQIIYLLPSNAQVYSVRAIMNMDVTIIIGPKYLLEYNITASIYMKLYFSTADHVTNGYIMKSSHRSSHKNVISQKIDLREIRQRYDYDYDYDYDYEISLFGHRRKKTNTKVS